MLNEFSQDCPLTPSKLEEWMKKIFQRLDDSVIDGEVVQQLLTLPVNTIVTSLVSPVDMERFCEVIERGDVLKIKGENESTVISTAWFNRIESDDYWQVTFVFFNRSGSEIQKVRISLEMIEQSVRMCEKTVNSL